MLLKIKFGEAIPKYSKFHQVFIEIKAVIIISSFSKDKEMFSDNHSIKRSKLAARGLYRAASNKPYLLTLVNINKLISINTDCQKVNKKHNLIQKSNSPLVE